PFHVTDILSHPFFSIPVIKYEIVSTGRRKQKSSQEKTRLTRLPDLKDAEAVQKFFLEEIQLGEELLAQGELSPWPPPGLSYTPSPEHY
uniref:Uncharacterized protein n=1 Tax=Hucho hucho TaxID=62062 RepID=A0A4W5Q2D7_9TELE